MHVLQLLQAKLLGGSPRGQHFAGVCGAITEEPSPLARKSRTVQRASRTGLLRPSVSTTYAPRGVPAARQDPFADGARNRPSSQALRP